MICLSCNKHLSECKCEDLEERLDSAVADGYFAYKYCKICKKHYERCRCKKPDWGIKGADEEKVLKKKRILKMENGSQN